MHESPRPRESESLHGGHPLHWRRSLNTVEKMRKAGWYTYLEPSTAGPGPTLEIAGRRMLNFVSNDYLGLSLHPEVIEGSVRATRRYGTGATASSTVCGLTPLHEELQERLAAWTQQESAVVFPSGFLGNLTSISTLVGEGDDVIIDRLDHASILDGARLSGARIRVFRHNDLTRLERQLERSNSGRQLLVVESVYSMDGDEADLSAICELAERYHALMMVDEAHSFGFYPPHGAGAVVAHGLAERVGLIWGSLSKCLGALGCFMAGSRDAVDFLQNNARGYIFSTGLAPAMVGAALTAVDLIQREPERIEHLWRVTRRFHAGLKAEGFDLGETTTPITPIRPPHPERQNPLPIVELGLALRESGVCSLIVSAPTVALRDTKLRLNVRGDMSEQDVDRALEIICKTAREIGFFD